MELQTFIENFADQFEDKEADAITGSTKFKDLEEWSSLIALSVIAMVDEEYGVAIKGDDIRNSETIQDLYNVIESRA